MSYPSLLLLHRILSFLLEAKNLRFLECLKKNEWLYLMKSWFIYLKLHLRRSHHLDGLNQQFFVTIIYQSQQFPFTYSFQKKNLFQTFKWVMYDWNFWIKCKINKQQVTMDPPVLILNLSGKTKQWNKKRRNISMFYPKMFLTMFLCGSG